MKLNRGRVCSLNLFFFCCLNVLNAHFPFFSESYGREGRYTVVGGERLVSRFPSFLRVTYDINSTNYPLLGCFRLRICLI